MESVLTFPMVTRETGVGKPMRNGGRESLAYPKDGAKAHVRLPLDEWRGHST